MSESIQAISPFAQPRRSSTRPLTARPSAREWFKHAGLLLITFATTTFAGVVLAAPEINVPEPVVSGIFGYFLYLPQFYLEIVRSFLALAILNPNLLGEGLLFSGTLLAILLAHEMGHYLACRYYGVNATLPFFIPAPPLFLAGTFGAFIKIKSPIPSRRALFDIGLAGPLAGFVVMLPIAVVGVLNLHEAHQFIGQGITFNDPLLIRLIAQVTGVKLSDALPNPFYMAAWIGLLVTSLNLMPVGQLDGGHGIFAIFGQRAHKVVGRLAFIAMALLAIIGFVWHGSPSGFLYTVLLAIMLKVRHPQPEAMEPLEWKRIVVGIITLIVFALSFWPFPITLT